MNRLFGRLMAFALALAPLSFALAQQPPIAQEGFPDIRVPPNDRDMALLSELNGNRSVRISINNGVKTIYAQEGDLKVEIIDDPASTIFVKVTRQYSLDDSDRLAKTHPEVFMHLKGIPKKIANSAIEVRVGITDEYEADSEEQLEQEHPEIHKIYKKYSKMAMRQNNLFGNEFFRRRMPNIRFGLDRPAQGLKLEIGPDGIQEIDDEDLKKQPGEKKRDQKEPGNGKQDKDT